MTPNPQIVDYLRANRGATTSAVSVALGIETRHVSRYLLRCWIAQEVAREGPAPFRWSLAGESPVCAPAKPLAIHAAKMRADERRQAAFVAMVRARPGVTATQAAVILGCDDRVIRARAVRAIDAGVIRCRVGDDGDRIHRYFFAETKPMIDHTARRNDDAE